MLARHRWRNEDLQFTPRVQVMLREEYNDNKAMHRWALGDHISRIAYIIVDVIQHDLVKIMPVGEESAEVEMVKTSRPSKYNVSIVDSEPSSL